VLRIFEAGTKIAYRNPQESSYLPEKTFNIADIKVEEMDAVNEFELITSDRVYELRMKTQQNRDHWLRAICNLKKDLRRKARKASPVKKKPKDIVKKEHNNDSTLPSIGPIRPLGGQGDNPSAQPSPNRMTYQSMMSRNSVNLELWRTDHGELKEKFQEHFKKLSPDYLQYHVFLGQLRTKVKELFGTSMATNYYVLFSSKSLYPDEHISEDNLTSAFLPHWADIDCLYRILEGTLTIKPMFELVTLKEVTENADNSLKLATLQDTF
jgi:hypothetical protein